MFGIKAMRHDIDDLQSQIRRLQIQVMGSDAPPTLAGLTQRVAALETHFGLTLERIAPVCRYVKKMRKGK